MMRLKSQFDEHIKKVDPHFFEREAELDQKRRDRKNKRSLMKKTQSMSEETGSFQPVNPALKKRGTTAHIAGGSLDEIAEVQQESRA